MSDQEDQDRLAEPLKEGPVGDLLAYGQQMSTDALKAKDRDQYQFWQGWNAGLYRAEAVVTRLTQEHTALRQKLKQEDEAHTVTIIQRDEAQEWADQLASIAGDVDEIGEHSNLNNPWANALEILQAREDEFTALRQQLKAAQNAAEYWASIHGWDREYEAYLDSLIGSLHDVCRDVADDGNEHGAAATRQATEAIMALRKSRDDARNAISDILRACLPHATVTP